jgi:transcriptional regulator with XRE-family HTH domain
MSSIPDFQESSTMQALLDWIRRGLLKPGKTQAGLARALGRSPSAINNLLSGKRRLRADEIARVARYLEEPAPRINGDGELAPAADEAMTVRVLGYVGDGGEAHRYAVRQHSLDKVSANPTNAETVAVEVRGDTLGPSFDRWLVLYDNVANPVTDDLIGKLCVVGLPDDRVFIKTIRRGTREGLFTLDSNTEPPIKDTPLEWAARVKSMMPPGNIVYFAM